MAGPRLSGGCQCGAVRYALLTQPDNPHICHCRMCQKAFGSFFAPWTSVPLDKFEVTRGALAIFHSSDPVERGFCRDCGTPLTIHTIGDDRIFVSIGSLDEPARVAPKRQYGVEGRLPWFDTITHLPGDTTTEQEDPALTAEIAASNHQHPDHDTAAMAASRLSGGCQCGAVRYAVVGAPEQVAVCHCRMCQKAVGSVVWPFFTVPRSSLTWTRGQPALYRSSAAAQRGFCRDCGTPLTFEPDGEDTIDLGIATLDDPATLKPTAQFWVNAAVPWFGALAGLPTAGLGDKLPTEEVTRRKPFQHPDHDTADWPPKGA